MFILALSPGWQQWKWPELMDEQRGGDTPALGTPVSSQSSKLEMSLSVAI